MRLGAFLPWLFACNLNQSGNLAATELGDTSHPLEHGSPIKALRDQCGDGAMLDTGAMVRRQPYLQQVSTTKAAVGWVSIGEDPERVTLSTGAQANAAIEDGDLRTSGEQQMWAELADLSPGTTYCYTLENERAMTAPTGFRTAPDPESTEPIRFLAFGDSGGGGADQSALRDQMYEFPFELMIHTGDLAYEDGTIGQLEDTVFGVYNELFKNLPFFPASGNHDYNTNRGAPFRQVFALPNEERWYSYDWGRIHFVALDTEEDYATQMAWLEQDLATTDQPWKIVYLHRPPYSSGEHGSDTGLRAKLAPVLERHGVQLVLAGHDHDYERMIPQNGVAYVVTGGGGRGTRNVGSSSFTAFATAVVHFVIVEVGMEELTLHAIDATGVEFDSMVVPRVAS